MEKSKIFKKLFKKKETSFKFRTQVTYKYKKTSIPFISILKTKKAKESFIQMIVKENLHLNKPIINFYNFLLTILILYLKIAQK